MRVAKTFSSFLEAGYICQVRFVYIIVTNQDNWHRDNLRLDGGKNREFENPILVGNLSQKFS